MGSYQKVKDFMGKEGPVGYVAGLGRGATGFTTRSDIGPARLFVPQIEESTDAQQQQPQDDRGKDDDDVEAGGGGDDAPLFLHIPYDAEDEEADRIYASVDDKMAEKRKSRREAREKVEREEDARKRPKITEEFADLKRNLATVSMDEWMNLPEPGNLRGVGRKVKKQGKETFTPVSDAFISGSHASTQLATSIDTATPSAVTPVMTDIKQFGEARETALRAKLDQVSDSASGQTTIDPKGYMTSLSSINIKSDAEIGDIKKAELLMKSVITTNPKHAPGWIAAARLQKVAGKIGQARQLIARGCMECPKNEDVWIEAAHLDTPDNAKVILANAIQHIPQSVKIWSEAAELETDSRKKSRVLRRALEFIPDSVSIWKQVVSLEEDEDNARMLLARAVECVPTSVDLWLALARLETYANAKKVLNRARQSCPLSYEVWIAAARLEENQGEPARVEAIILRAVDTLNQRGANLTREQWIEQATLCEMAEDLVTCKAIVQATIGIEVEEDAREEVWTQDAEQAIASKHYHTAREIFAHALHVMPAESGLWRSAADLEKQHGSPEAYAAILDKATQYCPQAEVLWLMSAKEKWLRGDIEAARAILASAFRANPDSEALWLAAAKLESETGHVDRARQLLEKARAQADTERVWMKSAVLERQQGDLKRALELIEDALYKYPQFDKLYMMKIQVEEAQGNTKAARESIEKGTKKCGDSIPLWLLASRFEERQRAVIRARATLNKARLIHKADDTIWAESVRIEIRAGNTAMAKSTLSRALQACPTSSLLWTESIFMHPRPQRKSKLVDALKRCESSKEILLTAARLFWSDRKMDKARGWFEKTIGADDSWGDGWAFYYAFEESQTEGAASKLKALEARCAAAEPRYGERWQRYAKEGPAIGKQPVEIMKLAAASVPNPFEVAWIDLYTPVEEEKSEEMQED